MQSLVVPLSILLASFLGSWHCAGMCGPLAGMAATHKSLWSYNFGRMLTYVSLGLAAGFAGKSLLLSDYTWLSLISAILIGAILIANGVALYSPKLKKPFVFFEGALRRLFGRLYEKGSQRMINSGFAIGVLSGLLPCGWLYSFVFASAATKSPMAGMLTMFLFWLGTLPALSTAGTLLRQSLQRASVKTQKVAGIILILAGVYSLASHLLLHNMK